MKQTHRLFTKAIALLLTAIIVLPIVSTPKSLASSNIHTSFEALLAEIQNASGTKQYGLLGTAEKNNNGLKREKFFYLLTQEFPTLKELWKESDKDGDKMLDNIKEIVGQFLGTSAGKDVTRIAEMTRNIILQRVEYHLTYLRNNEFDSRLNSIKHLKNACPTDVNIYNSDDELMVSIINNEVVYCDNRCAAYVENSDKDIYFFDNDEYKISIIATNDGDMDYYVEENLEFQTIRTISFVDVPLSKDQVYSSVIPEKNLMGSDYYALTDNDGNVVTCTEDTLPPVQNDVIDVIVAEELFEGYPQAAIDAVADAMFHLRPSVDVSGYALTVDDIVGLFSAVQKYYPSEYSVLTDTEFSYRAVVSPSQGIITGFRFYYGDGVNLSDYQKRVNDLQSEINKLVAQMEGMTDFEKALYAHDYIVLNCEYDLELLRIMESQGGFLFGDIRESRYTEYAVLVNGTGVCGSYALAYRAVLNAAGVDCLYLSSAEMNHGWNLVKIDGNWYHVDCCWDDPVPDTLGQVRREYFLRTDEEIMQLRHKSWTPGQYKALDTSFSGMPRYDDTTQKYENGKWYYLDSEKLYSSDIFGNNITEIAALGADAIDVQNGEIYYSSGRYILHYDPELNSGNYAYVLPKNKSGDDIGRAYIRNFYLDGDAISLYASLKTNDETKTVKYTGNLQEEALQKKITVISGFQLTEDALTLDVFETSALHTSLDDAFLQECGFAIAWSSSNNNIASVDENGAVLAKNLGEATITAEILDFTASCVVTVTGDGLSGMAGDAVSWAFDPDSHTLTISGNGAMTDFRGYNYTPWYSFMDSIESAVIVGEVTSIGKAAFYGCDSLTSISISNSVTSINYCAFFHCTGLTSISIPNSVTSIGMDAFKHCTGLTSISIPNSVTSIGANAFSHCTGLTSISIPNSVTLIESSAFSGCEGLESIQVASGNSVYKSVNNCLINKTSKTLIRGCKNSIIPEDGSVTSIGNSAFSHCSGLTSITIPNSVTSIGSSAFNHCSGLTSITIPNSVTSIAAGAFIYCSGLESICVDSGNSEFCSVDNCLISIATKRLLLGCKNSVIPEDGSVTAIDYGAFAGCTGLTSIVLPDSIVEIDQYAFYGCSGLTSVFIPQSVRQIESGAFANCSALETLDVSENNIEYYSQGNCIIQRWNGRVIVGCKNSVIPTDGSVTGIDSYAFTGCSDLYSINIPDIIMYMQCNKNAINSIYGLFGTFSDCVHLKTISLSRNIDAISLASICNTSVLTLIIPESVTTVDTGLWLIPDGLLGHKSELPILSCKKILISNPSTSIELPDGSYTLYGHNESTAQTYAEEHNIPFVDIDAQPHVHDYFLMDYKPATEDEDGYEYWECYCGEDHYTTVLHNYQDVDIAPTCTEIGVSKQVCTACGEAINVVETPALGHVWQETSRYGGSCVTPATVVYTCARCEATKEQPGEPDSGHAYEETVTPPTCEAYGYTEAICKDCGDSIVYDFTAPLGHKTSLTATTENCTAHGSYVYTCARCDYREEIAIEAEALETRTETTPATCTAAGTEKQICVLCGATVSTTTLRATGHSFSEEYTVDVPATCMTEGSRSRHCTKCDARIMTETIEPLGHSYGDWQTKTAPTCTAEGEKVRVCNNDASHVITETIAPLGHNYGSWQMKTPPTCTEEGVEERVCKNDANHTETRPIEKTSHRDTDGDGLCDTCRMEMDNGSHGTSNVCKYCGQIHPNTFVGRFIKFFHSIAYFFAHLFGKK